VCRPGEGVERERGGESRKESVTKGGKGDYLSVKQKKNSTVRPATNRSAYRKPATKKLRLE